MANDNAPNEAVTRSIRKFLNYSLGPIEYKYDDLTPAEQGLVTREEFAELVAWLKKG